MTETPPPPPPVVPGAAPAPSGGSGKGLAITSLVLGILSIVLCCYWFIGGPAGIAALITGLQARKRGVANGMALTGIITGVIGIVLAIIAVILTLTGNGLAEYCLDNPDNPICQAQ